MKQTGRGKRILSPLIERCILVVLDQTKGLEELNTTLHNRCEQLQNELSAMKDRYTQSSFRIDRIVWYTCLFHIQVEINRVYVN